MAFHENGQTTRTDDWHTAPFIIESLPDSVAGGLTVALHRQSLRDKLPLDLPQPCPICGAKVDLTAVVEWGADDGEISQVEYECETEPDIDSADWPDWHGGHYSMPYVDWLPWEQEVFGWLNARYHYQDESEG